MSTSDFWHNVLEHDETLLWVGRPEPRVHWRNWQLFGAPAVGALLLLGTGWFILSNAGTRTDMWLMIALAVGALVPANTSRRQLKEYAATRYALTDRRALFFRIGPDGTRVKSYPATAIIPPEVTKTRPLGIRFLGAAKDTNRKTGFDYINNSDQLLHHLKEQPA